MKKVRILSLALALGVSSVQVSCSSDGAKEEKGAQNETVDALYSVVRTVENDLSQGYLLRSASDNEREMFTNVLYDIKIATMRLRKNAQDGEALSALYLASQEFDKLRILELDGSQLDGLKQQLRLTLDVIAQMQGKTLENVERVLFAKDFDYELAPFAPLTAGGKAGWTKKNHNEVHYAIAEGSKLDSWLMSPVFDLTQVQNPSFSVKQAINSRGNPFSDSVFFMVSANYTGGDPAKADWDTIQVDRLPDGNGFAVIESENVSLAKYAGKKIVLAFHYSSMTAATYPTWQINSFKLLGSGNFSSTPLNLEGVTLVAPGQGPTVAAVCTANPSAKKIFSYQFTKPDLGTNFTKKEDIQLLSTPYEKYPNTIRWNGYGGKDAPNKVGTSWLVSKDITLKGSKEACLSFADESYFSSGNIDLSLVEVLVSSDYAGDPEKATWKVANPTGRKAATGVVVVGNIAPKAVGMNLKDLGLDTAEKVNVAFRYKTTLENAPWWGISDLTLTAVQAGEAPLVVTPVDGSSAPVAGSNRPSSGSGSSFAPPFVPNGPIVADVCKKDRKTLFSKQFTGTDLGSDFTAVDEPKNVVMPSAEFYPGFVRFSGYVDPQNNRAGTSWLVSKTVDLTNSYDTCLSVAEDIYVVKKPEDLNTTEILVSTDYTGDVASATWKKVDLQGRKTKEKPPGKTEPNPKANGILLTDLVGADAKNVTVAFRYTSAPGTALWWGIADVTVTGKTSGSAASRARPAARPANVPTTTPVSPVILEPAPL